MPAGVGQAQWRDANVSRTIRDLISLAARGLLPMFDTAKNMFCHRLLCTGQAIMREGVSPRYTAMTLLGLRELELAGGDSKFDTAAIYTSLVQDTSWVKGLGDLGLLIWVTATFDAERLRPLLSAFECETAPNRFADAREKRTMELAWFLAGLAHAAEAVPGLANSLMDLAVDTYHRLEENRGESGLFGHMGAKSSFAGRLRGRIGSFADQVYPIYALSKFSKVFEVEDPLGPALECATTVCGLQGQMGQWWWLYESRTGRVLSPYPVYSVHQHGMAPMCLFALEEATGQSFNQFIDKGLSWIYGRNELGLSMIDAPENLVWRCILPESRHRKFRDIARNFVGSITQASGSPAGIPLKLLHEQRPYEFGWLLFTFARRSDSIPRNNPVEQPTQEAGVEDLSRGT